MSHVSVLNCPGCGHLPPFATSFLSSDKLHISKCNFCELGFLDPMLDSEGYRVWYERLGKEYFLDPVKLQADHWKKRYDPEIRLISGLFPLKGRSLDIGCATGAFLMRLRELGQEGEGIELASAPVEWARERYGLDVGAGDFFSRAFPQSAYTLLTAWGTLEHLDNPARFLERCREILIPKGHLAFSVPNVQSLSHRFLGSRFRMVHPCHILYFHGKSFEKILARSGFEIIKKTIVRFNPLVMIRDFWGLRDEGTSEALKTVGQIYKVKNSSIFKPLRLFHRLALRVLEPLGLGDELLVLARVKDNPVTGTRSVDPRNE
jgi:2-polyprenyl-3-methyl-5-hydroxy-6-metoxy-1,4-benzoquinol methylase